MFYLFMSILVFRGRKIINNMTRSKQIYKANNL